MKPPLPMNSLDNRINENLKLSKELNVGGNYYEG